MADPNNNHPHVDPNANSPIARLYRLLNGPGFSCSGIRAPLIFASGDDTAAPADGSSPTNNNNGSSASNNDGSGEARLRGGGGDTEDEEKNKEDRSEYLEPNPHENSLFMNLVELLKELELQKENDHARNHPDKTITHRDATRGGASLPNDVTSALEDLLEHLLEDVQPHAKSPARTPQGPLDSKGDNNTNNDDAPPAYEPASRLRGGGNWLSREQAGGARPCHSQQQSPSPPPSPPSSPSSHHRPPFPAVAAHESAQDSKEGASKPRSLNPQQQHSTIVPLRNFPLPVPAVLKDSLVVQLPRSFCRQVHGRVRMAVDAWAAAEGSGARAWSSSPEPPSLRPLWSECFGEMSPREVAEHGRDYECRKGAGAGSRFQGPYWVKDREGRVRAVEREGERRELGRRWFGEEEEETVEEKKKKKKSEGGWGDGDEAVTGRLRGGGDDDDDDDGEGYDSDLHKWVRDDHNDWRIFTTSKLPRPADDYPPKSLIPRWFRRRPHRTIVPMPDFVLKPRFIGDRRNYMDFIFGPRKLGIGHSLEPPKLEITETSEPWEKVFTSWSPRELADLQRGWEEYQYGRYDGPYWNCDEQGNVRVVETKQAREELMEEWFGKDEGKGEGKDEGKDKGKAKWLVGKARLRGGGRFDDEADDSGSDLWEYRRRNQDNDGFVPLGSDGSSVRSTRGSSSSEEPAEGDRPFTPSPSNGADWETETRGLLGARAFDESIWHEEDKEVLLQHQHQTPCAFECEVGHSCQECRKSLKDEVARVLDRTSIARVFRSSLQEFPGELPSRYEVWREFRSWPEAWLSNGEFNRELWEEISRDLERIRRSRRHQGGPAIDGWLRGGGRFSPSSNSDSSGSEKRRRRRHRRAEDGDASAGNSGHHEARECIDLPYDLSTHFRESLGRDGNTVDMPWWAMVGAMEEWGIGEETFRPSSPSSPEKDPKKGLSGEEDDKGSTDDSGSDWEEFWGNLGPKRIPIHVTDSKGNARRADLRRALRLLGKLERAKAEHTGGKDSSHNNHGKQQTCEDAEGIYNSVSSERFRQALRQRCKKEPLDSRGLMYQRYLKSDEARDKHGRLNLNFWYRILEILDEEVGPADEDQMPSTGEGNSISACRSRDVGPTLRGGGYPSADNSGTSDRRVAPLLSASNKRFDEPGNQEGVQCLDDQELQNAFDFWLFWYVFGDSGRS